MRLLSRVLLLRKIAVDIYSKPDCCLCDQAQFNLRRMLGSLGPEAMSRVSVEKVNIEENEKLMDKYSLSIPVILVDGDVVAESIVDVPKVRKLIQQKLEKSG